MLYVHVRHTAPNASFTIVWLEEDCVNSQHISRHVSGGDMLPLAYKLCVIACLLDDFVQLKRTQLLEDGWILVCVIFQLQTTQACSKMEQLGDLTFQAMTLIIQGTRKASQNHVGRSALKLTNRVFADNR